MSSTPTRRDPFAAAAAAKTSAVLTRAANLLGNVLCGSSDLSYELMPLQSSRQTSIMFDDDVKHSEPARPASRTWGEMLSEDLCTYVVYSVVSTSSE